MKDPICSGHGCEKPAKSRGLCQGHYSKARRDGTLKMRVARISDVDPEAMTCTCTKHGKLTRLRIRHRAAGTSYFCRTCEGGGRQSAKPLTPLTPLARSIARAREKYGLCEAEFLIMRAAQAGRCLICMDQPESLVVDHCHDTGRVRGLLCHRCNVALGWMNDNPVNLTRAAKYLRRKLG